MPAATNAMSIETSEKHFTAVQIANNPDGSLSRNRLRGHVPQRDFASDLMSHDRTWGPTPSPLVRVGRFTARWKAFVNTGRLIGTDPANFLEARFWTVVPWRSPGPFRELTIRICRPHPSRRPNHLDEKSALRSLSEAAGLWFDAKVILATKPGAQLFNRN